MYSKSCVVWESQATNGVIINAIFSHFCANIRLAIPGYLIGFQMTLNDFDVEAK